MVAAPQTSTREAGNSARGSATVTTRDSVVERLGLPIGCCVSLIFFLRFAAYGTRRLWYDEISTTMVALQPSWLGVWQAFAAGVDAQPPLFAYITRISWLLLGRNELALRIPEILGIILFSWCLFLFIRPRLGTAFGLSAMILPLLTDLAFYAGEARPYGMLLGACGLALLTRRNAIEHPERRSALPLFALSLSLIVSLHAYAIIAVLMFGATELARAIRTRQVNRALWSCFLPVLPLMSIYWFPMQAGKAAGAVLGPSEWTNWHAVTWFYNYYFQDRIFLLSILALLAMVLLLLRNGSKPLSTSIPWDEKFLAAALALSPAFSVAMAVFITRYYRPRYSIFAMAGLTILTVVVVDAVAPSRRIASLSLLFVCLALFGLDQRYIEFSRDAMRKKDAALAIPFTAVPPNVPLVIANGLAMLPADLYSSDTELARTYYLVDRALAVKYTGSTFFDFGNGFTRFHHFRSHFVDYTAFIKEHKHFWVYGPYSYPDDWQVRKLKDDGARIIEKGRYAGQFADNFLMEVELP